MSLLHQRCFNHAAREAVARCLACGKHYCRECVTEHEERLICAVCLKRLTETVSAPRRNLAWVGQCFQASTGLVVGWLFFYWFGQALLAIPSSFHDANFWTSFWSEL